MKNFIYALFCIAIPTYSFGQSTTVSGLVQDEKQQPIQGANVYLEDSYDGTTTGQNGEFSFSTEATDQKVLMVHLIGYEDYATTVDLSKSTVTVSAVLNEEVLQLAGATVTASRDFEASDRHRVTVLKPLDILTTGGANADITYALQTMPGTQAVGNQTGLFVRGGTSSETRVYIDGLAVDNFYYNGTPGIAQRGRFSPDLFQGTFFSSGGYSALYGQALSSTLVLESRDLPDQSSVDASISSVGAEAGFDLLSKDKRGSIGATINYTNLHPYYNFVEQSQTFDKMPEYLDGTVNFRRKVGEHGMIKFYGSYGQSDVAIIEADLENPQASYPRGITNRNLYTNLTYQGHLGENTQLDVGTSFSTNQDHYHAQNLSEASNQHAYYNSDLYQIRSVLTRYYNSVEIRAGAEVLYDIDKDTYQSDRGNNDVSSSDYLTATFLEGRFTAFKKFRGQVGIRMENSSLLNDINVAPRASLAYLLSRQNQFSFSYGHFYQKPEESYLMSSTPVEYERSKHYILSFQRTKISQTLRAEVFYKEYDDLIKTIPEIDNTGFGYARGAEFFWRDKKTIRHFDYWLSYSFLDTKRDYLDYHQLVQPDFAAKHTASAVAKKFIPALSTSLGLTYTFSSGRPYYNPNRPQDEFMQDRTAPYHNLSAMIAYLTKIGQANTIFVVSVNNVLGSEQIFGYNYSTSDPSVRRASSPLAPRFFYAGVFFNWGVDKRQQTIDDLL